MGLVLMRAVVGGVVLVALSWPAARFMPIAHAQRPSVAPVFAVDAAWPKQLPNNWALGPVSGISTDARDHIWIIHRREAVKEAGRVPAPPVIEFDPAGNVVQTWGGPGAGYDWPQQVHGITVDARDRVWITGNGEKDTHILAFTRAGKFLRQIGRPGMSSGSNNTANVARATQVRVDVRANEIYVSDGEQNQNHRVIVFDSETGAYKRHWGAFGEKPDDAAIGTDSAHMQFGSAVHCVRIDRDGRVYVCDRSNSRFQIFRKDGTYQREISVAKEPGGAGTVYDLDFSPDQRFLYVADGVNQKVWILRLDEMRVVGSFGERGSGPGQFATSLHDLAVDSKGNLYTGEAAAGGRVQKFALKQAAQLSVRAGNAEWQRIRRSAPYEWEGDIEAIAEWTLRNYRKFLEEYPDHPLAAEAMFNVATATWASGGYPEPFHYIIAATWEEHAAKTRHLNQWFDTRGFGGGLDRVRTQDPDAARRAREMFIALAGKYPSSRSAMMARYYSAVILDYCLNDSANAVVEFRAFVKKHPMAAPYASKTKRRIAALTK
jgi:hypothetical protein